MTPEQLFADNYRIAFAMLNSHSFWRPHVEQDDMEQIALTEVWRAANAFDPSRGCKFVTLAGNYVFRAIQREVQKHLAKHRGGVGGHRSKHRGQNRQRFSISPRTEYDFPAEDMERLSTHPDLSARLIESERTELVSELIALMPERLGRAVWYEFVHGLDRASAASAAGFATRRSYQVTLDQWRRKHQQQLRATFGRRVADCLVP